MYSHYIFIKFFNDHTTHREASISTVPGSGTEHSMYKNLKGIHSMQCERKKNTRLSVWRCHGAVVVELRLHNVRHKARKEGKGQR